MNERRKKVGMSPGCRTALFISLILILSLSTCSTKNLLLTQETGSIHVTSDPSGAEILLDRGLTGKTTPDTLFDVPVGDHVVSVMQTGYLSSPDSVTVTVIEDGVIRAEFVLLETSYGSLKVTSSVDGATICMDNQPTAEVTPHVFFNNVPVGTHIVSVFKEGHSNQNPAKEVVNISTGDTVEVDFVLTPTQVGTAEGDITPDFDLEDDFGFRQRLYAHRGLVTMVFFWAEDCYFCMQEMPHLQQIYSDYQADTLIVFGVNYEDGIEVIRRIREDEQVDFAFLLAAGTDVKSEFQVTATPVTIILDRGGKIYFRQRGFQNPAIADRFREKLDELFGR